ncbi:FxDxF family PEP-CTERM protein [[Empedobacter] haloabium]|uniref:FxDxF family PEP-CTERM protein n=1 Tax=[Empedobacter] haloabium TaxID=592317 RepID=A0ABZ1URW3_9BURK
MKLKFAVAGLLAAASFSALASDQAIDLTVGGDNFFNSAVPGGDGVLSGGVDVITFGGLDAGVYNLVVTISGQKLTFDAALSNLNGVTGTFTQDGKYRFYGVEATGTSPFTLTLFGNADIGAKYSGEVTVSAVPEPTTYGMLLGGLGIMAFLARRKSKQA